MKTQLQTSMSKGSAVEPSKPEAVPDSLTLAIASRQSIYQEQLRQARASFNLASGLVVLGAVVGVVGVVLLSSGNAYAGKALIGVEGTLGVISVRWLKLSKDANDRLDKTASVLENKS